MGFDQLKMLLEYGQGTLALGAFILLAWQQNKTIAGFRKDNEATRDVMKENTLMTKASTEIIKEMSNCLKEHNAVLNARKHTR